MLQMLRMKLCLGQDMSSNEQYPNGSTVTHKLSGVVAKVCSYSESTKTLTVEDNAGIIIWKLENILPVGEVFHALVQESGY